MEELLITLLIIVLFALFIIPIVTLVKISSTNKEIDSLKNEIKALSRGMSELLRRSAMKDDTQEVGKVPDKVKTSENISQLAKKDVEIFEKQLADKNIVPEINTQPELEKENINIPEIVEKPITENIPTVVDSQKEETPPPFAALSRTNNQEEIITGKIEPTKPIYQPKVVEPKEPQKNFIERILGDNWLSKVGIITLVLGIAFFVKYAIDQDWINEIGRVGIGLLTGGLIIGIAHKLRTKYKVFSSILVGGGISVFYITITLAFREYHIFSQTVAFILLIVITIFSVVISLFYDRKELAIFSLLGGFASPLMISNGMGNYIVLFSYIFILNSGMLAISFIKKWKVIGIMCYVLTLLFFWGWLLRSFEDQYLGAALFAVLLFFQFYLLAIIDHFKSGKKVTVYQAILILTDNLSVFLACLYIFDGYAYDIRGIITITLAAVNAIIMLVLFRKSQIDRNLIYLIIAVVMTFVSLAVPIQLHGHVITMFWAAEMVLLLWLWQRSHIKIFSVGFLLISILTIISYIMDLDHNYTSYMDLPVFTNRICITGIVVVIAFIISSFLLSKEDADSSIELRAFGSIPVNNIIKAFKLLSILLIFLVPFLEINYQVRRFTDYEYISSFRYLALATYAIVFVALLACIYRKRVTSNVFAFILLFIVIILYTIGYSYLASNLRLDIFYYEYYSSSFFLLHLVSLPAITYIIYLLIRNIKTLPSDWFTGSCWTLIISSVIILSIELDNVVISLFGNQDNYDGLLYDVHTFSYPILWGLLAMGLMIWGLNKKEVLLRKISLIFFGLIILKFYAYDVWHMSQTGRIVSFVVLGIILLLVGFLQQKIKVLMKEDVKTEDIKESNKEQE